MGKKAVKAAEQTTPAAAENTTLEETRPASQAGQPSGPATAPAGTAQGGGAAGGEGARTRVLQGLNVAAPLQTKRKIDLTRAALPDVGSLQAVTTLSVRELKGVGAMFTPKASGALTFLGLVYKPLNEYETIHQILAGPLQNDPRVMRYAKRITFVPAFSWATFEVVLVPVKVTTFGRRVLEDMQKLATQFPHFKIFVEWDANRKRHVVYRNGLSEQEESLIASVKWPSQEEILDALSASAYEDLEDLKSANDDIRTLLQSREVE